MTIDAITQATAIGGGFILGLAERWNRGIDLQYRPQGAHWPGTWRVRVLYSDKANKPREYFYGDTPLAALLAAANGPEDGTTKEHLVAFDSDVSGQEVQMCSPVPIESLIDGGFYLVQIEPDPDAHELWESKPMPARYDGNGMWNFLDPVASDWPVVKAWACNASRRWVE